MDRFRREENEDKRDIGHRAPRYREAGFKQKRRPIAGNFPAAQVSFASTAGVGIAPHTVSPTRPGGSAVGRRTGCGVFQVCRIGRPSGAFSIIHPKSGPVKNQNAGLCAGHFSCVPDTSQSAWHGNPLSPGHQPGRQRPVEVIPLPHPGETGRRDRPPFARHRHRRGGRETCPPPFQPRPPPPPAPGGRTPLLLRLRSQ